jgi:hypothetical protein
MEFEVTVRIKAPTMATAISRLNVALNELPHLVHAQIEGTHIYQAEYDAYETEVEGLVSVQPRIINAKEVNESV